MNVVSTWMGDHCIKKCMFTRLVLSNISVHMSTGQLCRGLNAGYPAGSYMIDLTAVIEQVTCTSES